MAGGNNHAKQLLVDQGDALADDLQNGHAGDLKKIGNLAALTFKMMTPMYMNEFVTREDCINLHAASDLKRPMRSTRLKVGPVEIEGHVTTTLLLICVPLVSLGGVIFMAGKMQSWW